MCNSFAVPGITRRKVDCKFFPELIICKQDYSYIKLIHKDKVNGVRSEVFTAANMKIIVIRDVVPCSVVICRLYDITSQKTDLLRVLRLHTVFWDVTSRSFGLNRNTCEIPFHPHMTIQ